MTPHSLDFSPETVNQFLEVQAPKSGRKVIWNSYSKGTYVKALHGPIGQPKHQPKP